MARRIAAEPEVSTPTFFEERRCEKCGDTITQTALGAFYKCGHSPVAKIDVPESVPEPIVPPKPELVDTISEATTGIVAVTWGKELVSPKSFHTLEIGPFTATVDIRVGETISQAAERAYGELEIFARSLRERKRMEYLEFLDKVK